MAPYRAARVLQEGGRSARSAVADDQYAADHVEWPLRYLVAECMTMSAPCSSGRCRIGDAKVLSTTSDRACARSASRWMSTIFSIGLVGVSIQTNRVFGVIAASSRHIGQVDVAEVSRRCDDARVEQGETAAYRSSMAMMWSPPSSSSSNVAVAAMPEAKAKPRLPPPATQRS